MWDHLGLLDLLDRRWVFPHMKHPVPTEQVGSATPEISLTIRTRCSTPLLHNITTQTFCQCRFLYNFTPWGIITTHYDQSVIWPPVCFERPQCVLKSEDWSENYYVSFMASKLQANTNRKAACKCMKVSSCTSQFSSIQRDVSENYIWL